MSKLRIVKVVTGAALAGMVILAALGCSEAGGSPRVARSTLVLAIDVSGSFSGKKGYESAVDFAANYLYAHLHGLGGLKEPTAKNLERQSPSSRS